MTLVRPEIVSFRGATLPAKHLRLGGPHFLSDEDFLASGEHEVERLTRHCGLTTRSALLDVGCGPGRLPTGILSALGEIACYRGVDVHEAMIRWCKQHISRTHPTFQFIHLDLYHPRYNRSGRTTLKESPLPFSPQSFDIIYLYSVFSHLPPQDLQASLRDFHRLLRLNGMLFFTAFVEDDVPDVTENPQGYGTQKWKGPLHCVRYACRFLEELLTREGFRIVRRERGHETDGQSAYYLCLP
jgi:SAM-dependent methyltransferase